MANADITIGKVLGSLGPQRGCRREGVALTYRPKVRALIGVTDSSSMGVRQRREPHQAAWNQRGAGKRSFGEKLGYSPDWLPRQYGIKCDYTPKAERLRKRPRNASSSNQTSSDHLSAESA